MDSMTKKASRPVAMQDSITDAFSSLSSPLCSPPLSPNVSLPPSHPDGSANVSIDQSYAGSLNLAKNTSLDTIFPAPERRPNTTDAPSSSYPSSTTESSLLYVKPNKEANTAHLKTDRLHGIVLGERTTIAESMHAGPDSNYEPLVESFDTTPPIGDLPTVKRMNPGEEAMPPLKRIQRRPATMGHKDPIKLSVDDFEPPYSPISPEARAAWKGWVEVESEPVYINSMIRDLGIKGVRVEEIFDLEWGFASLRPPVHGLIFLFQYQETDYDDSGARCPEHVWFSRQLPANYSCATTALLNILLNANNVDLGGVLTLFKEDTMQLAPMERAHCLNEHEFIREVHNSFATRVDMWQADMIFCNKFERQKREILKRETDRSKAEEAAMKQENSKTPPKSDTPSRRQNIRRAKRAAFDDDEQEETLLNYNEDSGYHYVAYVPIKGSIWRLDGLNKGPQKLGDYSSHESWQYDAAPFLQARMDEFKALGILEFSLMALVEAPIVRALRALAENVKTLLEIEKQLDHGYGGWRQAQGDKIDSDTLTGPCDHHSLTNKMIHDASAQQLQHNMEMKELLDLRLDVVLSQKRCRESVEVQQVKETIEKEQVMKVKQDLNPMIHQVLLDLDEAGVVQDLMAVHRA